MRHKTRAFNIKDMRRGDIYVDQDGVPVFRDYKKTDKLHYISPYGATWEILPVSVSWPVDRIYKQVRLNMEDPRAEEKTFKKAGFR